MMIVVVCVLLLLLLIIIIMYIYHALINPLSAHMIHINLNMIFYIHVEHSPTKTTHTKHRTERLTPPPPFFPTPPQTTIVCKVE